jgi:hypothetical protein
MPRFKTRRYIPGDNRFDILRAKSTETRKKGAQGAVDSSAVNSRRDGVLPLAKNLCPVNATGQVPQEVSLEGGLVGGTR